MHSGKLEKMKLDSERRQSCTQRHNLGCILQQTLASFTDLCKFIKAVKSGIAHRAIIVWVTLIL